MKNDCKTESSVAPSRIAKPSRSKWLALALALVAGASLSQAVTVGQYYIHTPGTIRNCKGAFVIGRMDSSWGHAFIKQPDTEWSWGYMSGAGICGWIQNIHIPYKKDNSTWGSCPAPNNVTGVANREYLLSTYASEINDYKPGNLKDFGKRVYLNAGSWQTYGNYFNGGARHALGTITDARYVTWRYICKGSNNGYVLISHAPSSGEPGTWCFISMAAIRKDGYPKYENGIWCNLPHSY